MCFDLLSRRCCCTNIPHKKSGDVPRGGCAPMQFMSKDCTHATLTQLECIYSLAAKKGNIVATSYDFLLRLFFHALFQTGARGTRIEKKINQLKCLRKNCDFFFWSGEHWRRWKPRVCSRIPEHAKPRDNERVWGRSLQLSQQQPEHWILDRANLNLLPPSGGLSPGHIVATMLLASPLDHALPCCRNALSVASLHETNFWSACEWPARNLPMLFLCVVWSLRKNVR